MSPFAFGVRERTATAEPPPALHAEPAPPVTDVDDLWNQCRALVRRGGPYVPDEVAALSLAIPQAYERPIRDGLDVLTVQICMHFPRVTFPAAPPGPTPFDEAIAAAEVELEAVAARELEARARYQRLSDTARAHADDTAKWQRLMDEGQAALQDHHAAEAVWLRARSRVTALSLSRDRWRLDQET